MKRTRLAVLWSLIVLGGFGHAGEAPKPATEDQEPRPSDPVKASMAFRPARVTAGATVELVVTVRIARAHYLHADKDPGGKFTPLGITATLPTGLEGVGDWQFPPPAKGRNGTPKYFDIVQLKRTVRVASDPPSREL